MATVTVLTLRWACLVVLTSLARLEDHDDDDDIYFMPKAGYGLVVMMMMMIVMEIVMMRMVMAVTLKIIEKQPCAGLLPTIRKYVTLCKTGIDNDI